jgi:hypothetical protein
MAELRERKVMPPAPPPAAKVKATYRPPQSDIDAMMLVIKDGSPEIWEELRLLDSKVSFLRNEFRSQVLSAYERLLSERQ